MRSGDLKRLNHIAQTIFDKKGCNILALDVSGISTMTEFFVIAEGSSRRHVRALSSGVVDAERELGHRPLHVDGQNVGDWVVIDYGDILVHLFQPPLREKYDLEELWREAKIVDLNILVDS